MCKAVIEHIGKKHKKLSVKITPAQVKPHLWVSWHPIVTCGSGDLLFVCSTAAQIFVNSLIVNPKFDSQTKHTLTSQKKNFGSTCELSASFMKSVFECGVVDRMLEWAQHKESKVLAKNDGKKKTRLTGIEKLDDANDAGGKFGHLCTLILTEGDSAKALAVSGFGIVGRDRWGVFPLKGKFINVREVQIKTLAKNQEVRVCVCASWIVHLGIATHPRVRVACVCSSST